MRNETSKRLRLRFDHTGSLVYFPFALVGPAYRVASDLEATRLARFERRWYYVCFAVYVAAVLAAGEVDGIARRSAIMLTAILSAEAVGGLWGLARSSALERLPTAPTAITRLAEAAATTPRSAFRRLLVSLVVLVAFAALVAVLDPSEPLIGITIAFVAGYGLWLGDAYRRWRAGEAIDSASTNGT